MARKSKLLINGGVAASWRRWPNDVAVGEMAAAAASLAQNTWRRRRRSVKTSWRRPAAKFAAISHIHQLSSAALLWPAKKKIKSAGVGMWRRHRRRRRRGQQRGKSGMAYGVWRIAAAYGAGWRGVISGRKSGEEEEEERKLERKLAAASAKRSAYQHGESAASAAASERRRRKWRREKLANARSLKAKKAPAAGWQWQRRRNQRQ